MNALTWSDADMSIIARFPIITIEKWSGCNSTAGCYVPEQQLYELSPMSQNTAPCPTFEESALANAKLLRQRNPKISVVVWYDSLRIYAPSSLNPDILDKEWQSCVRQIRTPFLEAHSEYLLHNTSEMLALDPYIHAHVYDHRSATVRDFWRDACLNMTKTGWIDGCGADASQQAGSYINGLSPDVEAAWTAAHIAAVKATTTAVSAAGGVVLGKLVEQLGTSTNGVLQEGCTASNATVNTLRSAAAAAKRDATRYIYECHSDGTESDMAAFLVGAGVDAYWGFGTWVSPNGGVASSWILEFELPLGAPLSDATYTDPIWVRRFESGTNVTFNARTKVGTISWGAKHG